MINKLPRVLDWLQISSIHLQTLMGYYIRNEFFKIYILIVFVHLSECIVLGKSQYGHPSTTFKK